MTITETLEQIVRLYKEQLSLLKTINDSFFTKKGHLSTVINNTQYTIPSFLSLENKVNFLQDAFDNLVNAPKTGEAWYNFDGNSRAIQLRGYQQAPNPIEMPEQVSVFKKESVNMFKDMLTPSPYINIDLSAIPDDISRVCVKKVVIMNADAVPTGVNQRMDYTTLMENLAGFTPNVDYIEYDTINELPVKSMASGQYIVDELVSDNIDDQIQEYITVKIRDNENHDSLTYKFQDGQSGKDLAVGDKLITYNGTAKFEITDIQGITNQLVLKVLNGEYVNIIPANGGTPGDYSILRYYKEADFKEDKYVHIPLEEDRYVFIAVAPLDSRMNVRSEWGNGIMLDVDSLKDEEGVDFRTYYNQYVKNVGDTLTELSTIISPAITKYDQDDYNLITGDDFIGDPNKDESIMPLEVIQINKHMNDSESVQNIRSLYKQKVQYQASLQEVTSKISVLQDELSSISFDDMSGTRSMYTAQITDLKEQQNKLNESIKKAVDAIAQAANEATIPIEDSKFRIRGYLDVEKIISDHSDVVTMGDVIGIQVRYRYKNPDTPQANIQPIGSNFVFPEWVMYAPPSRSKYMKYQNGTYNVYFPDIDQEGKLVQNTSEIKFNQIDIPITQGETVDIQARIVWGFGYPYVECHTGWTTVKNVTFPEELTKDVSILSIIEENNNDIETNYFENILEEKGIIEHVSDSITDQNITYFHRPENISSGFYTDERRIIPLRDKLLSLDSMITSIQDTLLGTSASTLSVTFTLDNIINDIQPDINNIVHAPAFNSVVAGDVPSGGVMKTNDLVTGSAMLTITNNTKHSLRLFPCFPASVDSYVNGDENNENKIINWSSAVGTPNDFKRINNGVGYGPCIMYNAIDDYGQSEVATGWQRGNQIIYFRAYNPFDGDSLSAAWYTRGTQMKWINNDAAEETSTTRSSDSASPTNTPNKVSSSPWDRDNQHGQTGEDNNDNKNNPVTPLNPGTTEGSGINDGYNEYWVYDDTNVGIFGITGNSKFEDPVGLAAGQNIHGPGGNGGIIHLGSRGIKITVDRYHTRFGFTAAGAAQGDKGDKTKVDRIELANNGCVTGCSLEPITKDEDSNLVDGTYTKYFDFKIDKDSFDANNLISVPDTWENNATLDKFVAYTGKILYTDYDGRSGSCPLTIMVNNDGNEVLTLKDTPYNASDGIAWWDWYEKYSKKNNTNAFIQCEYLSEASTQVSSAYPQPDRKFWNTIKIGNATVDGSYKRSGSLWVPNLSVIIRNTATVDVVVEKIYKSTMRVNGANQTYYHTDKVMPWIKNPLLTRKMYLDYDNANINQYTEITKGWVAGSTDTGREIAFGLSGDSDLGKIAGKQVLSGKVWGYGDGSGSILYYNLNVTVSKNVTIIDETSGGGTGGDGGTGNKPDVTVTREKVLDNNLVVYPMINSKYALCINSESRNGYMELAAGQSISIPMIVAYNLGKKTPDGRDGLDQAQYTFGFNVRNSLYMDPLYYEITVCARLDTSLQDSLNNSKASIKSLTEYNVTVK